jgi:ferredoxin
VEVSLDQVRCRGDCICELICPQIFVLDEGGIAYVTENGSRLEGPEGWAKVPRDLEPLVLDAASECPERAIFVRTESAEDPPSP